MRICESLRSGDLRYLVKPVFEIDSYKSKIGRDQDVIVLSFTVTSEDPALDIEHFIEMGYTFVLDADVTPGETDDGNYRVFVEIERSRHAPEQILEVVNGIKKIAGLDEMRFRYFKGFKSQPCSLENLQVEVPTDAEQYQLATQENMLENFGNFFAHSHATAVEPNGEHIVFKSVRKDPIAFKPLVSGDKESVYESISGPLKLNPSDIAEVLYLTKYIGNYNITKIGNAFIFENDNYAVALERV